MAYQQLSKQYVTPPAPAESHVASQFGGAAFTALPETVDTQSLADARIFQFPQGEIYRKPRFHKKSLQANRFIPVSYSLIFKHDYYPAKDGNAQFRPFTGLLKAKQSTSEGGASHDPKSSIR